eukprot:6660750-Pyramimonas_sp.AAC.1
MEPMQSLYAYIQRASCDKILAELRQHMERAIPPASSPLVRAPPPGNKAVHAGGNMSCSVDLHGGPACASAYTAPKEK